MSLRIVVPTSYAWYLGALMVVSQGCGPGPGSENVQVIPVGKGWAKTSVNTTIFRHDSVTTFGDTQYVAFYDGDQTVILAERKLDSTAWKIKKTALKGNCK